MASGKNTLHKNEVISIESLEVGGIPVTASAAELNSVDVANPGTAEASKAMVTSTLNGIGGFRMTSATVVFTQPAPAAKTVAVTLTAAEIMNGLITGVSGAAGNANYTLPLGSSLEASLIATYPQLQANDSFDFTLINISAVATDTLTIVTNTGWTTVGSMLVDDNNAATNSSGLFRVRRTAANTYTLYRIA